MSEKEIRELAQAFQLMVERPEWKLLVEKINSQVESIKENVIQDREAPRWIDRGIIIGMRRVIDYPIDIIKQYEQLTQ